MTTGFIVLIVLVVVGLLAVMWGVGIYNQLVVLKNRVQNAFSQIEVQL
jgi:LemA protein